MTLFLRLCNTTKSFKLVPERQQSCTASTDRTRIIVLKLANIQNVRLVFCTLLFMWTKVGVCEYKKWAGVWEDSTLDKRKANWKHMCYTVQQFSVFGWGGWLLLWMRVLLMGERNRGMEKKKICLWGTWGWGQRQGGHENVNPDVSEVIYSSLGI